MNHPQRRDRPLPYLEKKNRLFEDCASLDLALLHRKFCRRVLLRQFAGPHFREPIDVSTHPLQTLDNPSSPSLRLVASDGELIPNTLSLAEDPSRGEPLTFTLENQILKIRDHFKLTAS